ncbi:hypothetical protein BGW80DRAFT_1464305 [Lactifluus volemus]|nr:hypothetical protein BGW80DRAFT_1464305 [Lactifluus volemus]
MSQTYGIGHRKDNLKLGRTGRQLFEVIISLDGPEVNPPMEWSAKKREECLEKLKESWRGRRNDGEEREEVEREMGWAQDMFGEWLIDGHVDSVFRASLPLEDVAVSSYLSGSSGRLTTPGASIMLSPEQSPFRGNCHSSHHKSRRRDKSCPHSPGLTSPTPSQASGRHRNSRQRRDTPPLPTPPLSIMVLKPTEGPARKRSWRPFCIQGAAASVSYNGKKTFHMQRRASRYLLFPVA